jgi:hypothetical protein
VRPYLFLNRPTTAGSAQNVVTTDYANVRFEIVD